MFNFFKKSTSAESTGRQMVFAISGMHCTSCSLNIDGALEDLPGVISATTSYAKSQTTVVYQPDVVTPEKLKKTIEALDYSVTVLPAA